MKKILLSVVALAATVCGAQAANFNEFTGAFGYTAKASNVQEATAAQAAFKAPARAAKKASKTIDEICGSYVAYETYLDTTYTGAGTVTISKINSDSVSITGLFLGGTMSAAYVGDTIYIPSQVNYTSKTYGTASVICLFEQNGTMYQSTARPIRAVVNPDGSIVVVDWCYVVIDSGTYEGYYLDHEFESVILNHPNATMVTTFYKSITNRTDRTNAVYVDQIDDSTLVVNNFLGYGNVQIDLAADSTITIPNQFIYDGGSSYGTYKTYAADYSATSPSGLSDYVGANDITGTGTETTLSWGKYFIGSTTTNYWAGAMETGTITANEGVKFAYPTKETGVNDVNAVKTAVATTYYNVAGQQSAQPFSGLNIVVTRFADGTTSAAKVIK